MSEGPIARMITLLFAVPVAIIPPIRALSPLNTRSRVEMFPNVPGVAVGVDVAVAVGVGVGVGVAEGSGVVVALGAGVSGGVTVGVALGVGVGVAGGVAVGVGDTVGVGDGGGVGVASDWAQYFPPLFKKLFPLYPPQMIISLPVQIAECECRALCALMGAQLSVPGLYLPPLFSGRKLLSRPPQISISLPVQIAV